MPRLPTWTTAGLLALAVAACAKPPVDPATRATSPGNGAAAPATGGADAGAAGTATPSAAAAGTAVAWDCEGRPVTADYDNAAGQVRLQVGAELLTLPQAPSGSGARYADAAGNEFWEHQGEATLTLAGGKPQRCVHEPAH